MQADKHLNEYMIMVKGNLPRSEWSNTKADSGVVWPVGF